MIDIGSVLQKMIDIGNILQKMIEYLTTHSHFESKAFQTKTRSLSIQITYIRDQSAVRINYSFSQIHDKIRHYDIIE